MNVYFGIGRGAFDSLQSYMNCIIYHVRIDNVTFYVSQLKYGLLQSSVLGAILLTVYNSTTADIIRKHGLNYHCYADDTQIYISIDPSQSTVNKPIKQMQYSLVELLNGCRGISWNWTMENIYYCGRKNKQWSKVNITHIRVGDIMVIATDSSRTSALSLMRTSHCANPEL